ncbi:DNA repair/transcription protein mms19 [Ceratocystis platani]|uniref:MMS19 nucleotide excision repair protein n=1 Tax=Ceratocystis fimbriata f. sp. platani TaxID=88771 RepID=A0A0F8D2L1_CERFI|nr:DNA repair/transcription protein mms19 [Ceratocystis platani]
MADFDQLALKFVLEDDHPTRDALAAEAAEVIKSTPRASNPIRKWVESVRPWILGDDGEAGSGDRIARARALDFLSTTLHLLDKDFLRLDQIKVLIAYFSSMFTIDHRSGILPSAKALSTLTSMEFFPVDAAPSMLHSVCAMGDEFRNQIPVTRLAVYELFTTCVTNPAIASELRSKQSPDLVFIKEMIAMCGSERDPKNILKWFGLLAIFLREFHPSTELSLEIFNTFSAYFPISLRASQHPSGITADDLKLALRDCFVANPLMAPHAFPFLLSKIEQGTAIRLLYLQKPEGLSDEEQLAFRAVDPTFVTLYESTLKKMFAERSAINRNAVQSLVNLAAPFNDGSDSSRRFIFFLGQLSTYVISQLTEKQQQLLSLQEEVFALFHSDVIKKVIDTVHPAEYFEEKSPDTLLSSPSIVPSCLDLSTSCLQALRPSVVSGLFSSGVGQEVIAQCLLSHDATEPTVARAYWLTVLANKHAFEKSPKLLALLESRLAVLVTSSDDVLVTANAVYGLLAGALRRYTGSSLSASLDLLRKLTSNPTLGHIFAQWYDYLFSPKPRLAKAFHGLTKPTWTQRAYIELLVPLLQAALPCPTSNPTEKLAAANATVAVLAAVRHLSFTVYQDDAPVLVRTVLAALSTLPSSLVAAPALAILEAVMASSPTLLESHARSAIDVCLRISVLDTSTASIAASADNSWMPSGFGEISNPGPVLAAARKSALALLGQMPERFEHRHLVELAPRVKRALAVASGDKVRAVRGIATKARMAWNTVDA